MQKQFLFHASFVYGLNTSQERKELWRNIHQISRMASAFPWVLLGDFNVVRHPEERRGGATNWPTYMDDFNECCYENSLDDLRHSRNMVTWSKAAGESFLARKLDRVLVNNNWLAALPNAAAEFPTAGPSDHSPTIVRFGLVVHHRRPSFKFYNFWAEDSDFLEIVSRSW